MGLHPDWIVPDWPVPARVHAVCTTRAGGVSRPPYDSLNLGDHVQDEPQAVDANRRILREATAVRPVFLRQVHGSGVAMLDPAMPDGVEADASVSSEPGLACAILVADCLPVLLADARGTVVAAAHAGWRGLAGTGGRGVLEAVFERFSARVRELHGAPAATGLASATLAWLGPCIGPRVFEVGAEVREAFCAGDAAAARHFLPGAGGKYLADLAGLARQRLRALGITRIHGNDGSAAWCTVGQPSRFFSFRRDQVPLGGSGRLAACVWLA